MQNRLIVLDAYRGLAILVVVAYHFLYRWAPPAFSYDVYGYDGLSVAWVALGDMGVQFFFMISGFVILMTVDACRSPQEFVIKRFARLFPALVCCSVITFLLTMALGVQRFTSSMWDLVASVLMMGRYAPGAKWVDGAYWSLLVEVKFYGMVWLAMCSRRIGIVRMMSCVSGCGLALVLLGKQTGLSWVALVGQEVFLAQFLPFFMIGTGFYCHHAGRRLHALEAWGVAMVGYMIVHADWPLDRHACVAAMVLLFAVFRVGALNRVPMGWLVFVGSVSYSWYLLHQYIGVSLIVRLKTLGAEDWIACLIAVVATCSLAVCVYRFVEVPWRSRVVKLAMPRFGGHGEAN